MNDLVIPLGESVSRTANVAFQIDNRCYLHNGLLNQTCKYYYFYYALIVIFILSVLSLVFYKAIKLAKRKPPSTQNHVQYPFPNQIPNRAPMQNKNNGLLLTISLIAGILVSVIIVFASGYYVASIGSVVPNKANPPSSLTPTTPIDNIVDLPNYSFLPNKHYFDDTIIAVTKDEPTIALVATAQRIEQDDSYTYTSRISYYDGNSWKRAVDSSSISENTIAPNKNIKAWSLELDKSRVLKQRVRTQMDIDNTDIVVDSGDLYNEIGMRSIPSYTKFMSTGEGTIIINGQPKQAYILYTQIYSLDSEEFQFSSRIDDVSTDWVVFWDDAGNFYHLDKTSVGNPQTIYQSHEIGVKVDSENTVSKTFSPKISKDKPRYTNQLTVNLPTPINSTVSFTLLDTVNKAFYSTDIWKMGLIEGTASTNNKTVSGKGLYEYIIKN